MPLALGPISYQHSPNGFVLISKMNPLAALTNLTVIGPNAVGIMLIVTEMKINDYCIQSSLIIH